MQLQLICAHAAGCPCGAKDTQILVLHCSLHFAAQTVQACKHHSVSSCAMSFQKRSIAKGFPFLLILTCYKHPFLRNCQQHLIQPRVHHYHPALHGDPGKIFSLIRYSFEALKGFLCDSRYRPHRYVRFHH